MCKKDLAYVEDGLCLLIFCKLGKKLLAVRRHGLCCCCYNQSLFAKMIKNLKVVYTFGQIPYTTIPRDKLKTGLLTSKTAASITWHYSYAVIKVLF